MDATSLKELELAALAAGYIPIGLTEDGTALRLQWIDRPWNPRDENPHSDCMGDALRLAVALRIDFYTSNTNGLRESTEENAVICHHYNGPNSALVSLHEPFGADPYAATRLAITRAAASIGEKMRQEEALRQLSKLSDEMGEEL